MITTLNKIREHSPCSPGWAKLLKHLNKTKADDEPVSLLTILDSNGLGDAIWCLRTVDGYDREIRLFAVWCARQVEGVITDNRVAACNYVTERFANGLATRAELDAAMTAAWAAAVDAAWAAKGAAMDDARAAAARAAAARAAAWAAGADAGGAAWAAAMAAAWAAWDDAGGAAWAAAMAARDAARVKQETKLREMLA